MKDWKTLFAEYLSIEQINSYRIPHSSSCVAAGGACTCGAIKWNLVIDNFLVLKQK